MSQDVAKQEAIARLAQRLYVQLAAQATTFTGNAPHLAATPDSIAQLSFKLAEAYVKCEQAQAVAATPGAKGFDMNTLNFDDMMASATPVAAPVT